MTVAVGEGDDAGHHVVGRGHLHPHRAHARGDLDDGAVVEPAGREVVRVHQQVVPRPAAGQPGRVVEPRVVVLLVPPPDQDERVVRPVVEPGAQPVEVADEQRRHQVDPVVGGLEPVGHGRAQRPEVDALGMPPQSRRGEPPAGQQQQRDLAGRAGTQPGPAHGPGLARGHPVEPALEPRGQVEVDLPLVARVGRPWRRPPGEPGRVADRQAVEDQVVVVALEGGGRRQDDVGVTRGLVEVDVDRDHEVERVERRAEPAAVRRRQHRVARDRHERVDLASPGVSISSRIAAAGNPRRTPQARTRLR